MGLPIKALRRGGSSQADTLLDWLELGCFDALARKHLRTMVFAIYTDSTAPHTLCESYQFDFSYPQSDAFEFAVSSLNINACKLPLLSYI